MNSSGKTLYLHCGYHKTGSSFLQTMFARHRDLLHERSIHYPVSSEEYEMLKGVLTHGNGKELSDALTSIKEDQAINVLQNGIKEATKNGCKSLLYSAEGLFHLFPKEKVLERLTKAAKSLGFSKVSSLIYFRDPVSHALSTYKHRAKRGGHPDFAAWVRDSYETMGLIRDFCSYHSEFEIEWNCRKYSSDSRFMASSAFGDWLETEIPPIPEDDRVNSSLTLSEIRLLQAVTKEYSEAIPYLYKQLIEVEKKEKSREPDLAQWFEKTAAVNLQQHYDTLDKINGMLPDEEKLNLDKLDTVRDFDQPVPDMTFSSEQALAIAKAAKHAANAQKPAAKARDLLERGSRKIIRKLKASGF
jgi:hypothetical protein